MKARFLLLFIGFLTTSLAFAKTPSWGPTGHRTTGKIAEKHLTKKANRQINELLKGESLAFVSTYGDEIKSDKKYNDFYTWHYVNMPLDSRYEDSEKNPKGDLVTGIINVSQYLKMIPILWKTRRFI